MSRILRAGGGSVMTAACMPPNDDLVDWAPCDDDVLARLGLAASARAAR